MSGRRKEPGKFSQFDEEFILKDLWGNRGPGRCADIGARGQRGSNVAAFLYKGWFCQLIDKNVNGLRKDFPTSPGCKHQLVHATVTPENINSLLAPDLDLLSIDVDGNDYYLFEALNQSPKIVVIETNPKRSEGVQELNEILRNDFASRAKRGCSVPKMLELGASKGYRLHQKTGVNLIFVHETELHTPA